MSLSGSAAARKSLWAITRFARSPSMNGGRKMIRSFSSREKMSNARSPRGVCSTTIGTNPIERLLAMLSTLRRYSRVVDEEIKRPRLLEPMPQPLEIAALVHHATDRRRRPLALGRDRLDLALDVGLAGSEALRLRDRVEQQDPAHRLLRAGPQLGGELLIVPAHAIGVHTLAPHALPHVLDNVRD